jgi:hypothetical protein
MTTAKVNEAKPRTPFAELLQGTSNTNSPLGKVINHISESGGKAFSTLSNVYKSTDEKMEVYAPYLTRLILEITTTAVIGRLDPFRLLVLAEVQKSASHEIGKPNTTSMRWQGDVLANDNVKWSQDLKLENYPRALLGDCWDKFAWQHAVEEFIDAASEIGEKTAWIDKICAFEPNRFVPQLRTNFANLYSSLSKGIHLEFVLPPQEKFDLSTLSVIIEDVIFWSATILTLSNFIDHAAYKLDPIRAMELLIKIEQEQSKNAQSN